MKKKTFSEWINSDQFERLEKWERMQGTFHAHDEYIEALEKERDDFKHNVDKVITFFRVVTGKYVIWSDILKVIDTCKKGDVKVGDDN